MRLNKIKYSQFDNKPREWILEQFDLGSINLIVGKNASGKSKTLALIYSLANLLSSFKQLPFISGNYEAHFDNEGKEVTYSLKYEDKKVLSETLKIDSEIYLSRKKNGTASVHAKQLRQDIKYQIPDNEIFALTRRDSIQHPFLNDLYVWGQNLMFFPFGTQLGKDYFASFAKDKGHEIETDIDYKNTFEVIKVFRKGMNIFSQKFLKAIKTDMNMIGYDIDHIKTGVPLGMIFESPFLKEQPLSILVKESDLKTEIDQTDMSQGMFRALSLIIQLNYAVMTKLPSCILVDDIGEGLDFDRSSRLVKLLIRKAENTKVQLIMATNDRFIMNNVPLQYWSIIHREASRCRLYNYKNSPKLFDNFALTGLNNFDFFSSAYFLREAKKRK
jgi:energy-coupling factor transporter ATP-binding protein EcfA2